MRHFRLRIAALAVTIVGAIVVLTPSEARAAETSICGDSCIELCGSWGEMEAHCNVQGPNCHYQGVCGGSCTSFGVWVTCGG